MTIKLLPNYFKKIGLILFLITATPGFIRGFLEGLQGYREGSLISQWSEYSFFGIHFTETFFYATSIISVIGLIIYALSRDKVFDEFLQKLRLEAMHFTFFLSMVIVFALLLMDIKSEISALYLIELQVLIFLITYKIKKVNMKPSGADSHE